MKPSAIDKALRILDLLVEHPEGLRPADLMRSTAYPSGTVQRLLATLIRNGYAHQDGAGGPYVPGYKIVYSFGRMVKGLGLQGKAALHLKRLTQATGYPANLAVLRGDQVLWLESTAGDRFGLVVYSPPGTVRPVHSTGLGKAILAFLPDPELEEYLRTLPLTRYTPTTITSQDELRKCLALVRQRGYATDDEESATGCRCIAAPVHDHRGRVVAAVSISAPAYELLPEGVPAVADLVMETARGVSADLGYAPASAGPTTALSVVGQSR